MLARFDAEPDLARGRAAHCAIPTARTTRRRGGCRRSRVAVGHAPARAVVAAQPASPRATASSTPTRDSRATSTGCRAPRCGLRRAALDAVGGWDERYFMYMEDVDLCWRLRRSAGDVALRARGSAMHVQGASTRAPSLPDDHRAPPIGVPVRRAGVGRASRRWLLLPAAAFLVVRAALAMAAHAPGARSEPPRVSG